MHLAGQRFQAPRRRTGSTWNRTGDPASLAAIKKSEDTVLERFLGTAMNLPSRCEEEDRRALQVLARSGGFNEIRDWFCLGLQRERPGEDLHRVLREALRAGGTTEHEIAVLTVVTFPSLQKGGQPNSAGRYVLALSEEELMAAVSRFAESIL